MADYSVERLPELTIFRMTGTVTGVELLESLRRMPLETPLELWDLREADLTGLSAADVRALAALNSARHATPGVVARTALLTGSDLGYGLGRMFATMQDLQGAGVPHEVFREAADALSWLEGGPREHDGG